jgi:hypothetical protein
MTPEPYTRDTLKRIRNLAPKLPDIPLAAELGWPVSQLRSIADKHTIRLMRACIVVPATKITQQNGPAIPPVSYADGIAWSRRSGIVVRHGLTAQLGPLQSTIFTILLQHMRDAPGEYVPSFDICDATSATPDTLSTMKKRMNKSIAPLALTAQGHRNPGGYRLVDLLAREKEAAE